MLVFLLFSILLEGVLHHGLQFGNGVPRRPCHTEDHGKPTVQCVCIQQRVRSHCILGGHTEEDAVEVEQQPLYEYKRNGLVPGAAASRCDPRDRSTITSVTCNAKTLRFSRRSSLFFGMRSILTCNMSNRTPSPTPIQKWMTDRNTS